MFVDFLENVDFETSFSDLLICLSLQVFLYFVCDRYGMKLGFEISWNLMSSCGRFQHSWDNNQGFDDDDDYDGIL